MSATLGVGVPVPKMLPITGTWTLPFAAYLSYLSLRVVNERVKNDRYMGDRLKEGTDEDQLQLEVRSQTNFSENVPLALVLSAIAELNGANRRVLNYALAVLFVLRILHVEVGIKGKGNVGWGRPLGFFGTQGFLAGTAAYGTYLVKGYWGY